MLRRWTILAALAALLAIGVVGAITVRFKTSPHQFAGLTKDPPLAAPDFTLTDETGQAFTLSSLRGQWVLLAYGYTSCPDICPATLASLTVVKQQLGPQASQVRVVFATVDPERDTVEVMRQYIGHFGTDFKGLTGSLSAVTQAAQVYGVTFEKQPAVGAVGYSVNHATFVYLLDPQFRWRVTYPFGIAPQEIAADLHYLMAGQPQ